MAACFSEEGDEISDEDMNVVLKACGCSTQAQGVCYTCLRSMGHVCCALHLGAICVARVKRSAPHVKFAVGLSCTLGTWAPPPVRRGQQRARFIAERRCSVEVAAQSLGAASPEVDLSVTARTDTEGVSFGVMTPTWSLGSFGVDTASPGDSGNVAASPRPTSRATQIACPHESGVERAGWWCLRRRRCHRISLEDALSRAGGVAGGTWRMINDLSVCHFEGETPSKTRL